MSPLTQVLAITVGVFGSVFAIIHFQDTYLADRKEIERDKLEKELKVLIDTRKRKEALLSELQKAETKENIRHNNSDNNNDV